jgi:hypothetical protein
MEDKWLHGQAPKELAPDLFKIAKFKHRTVHTEMHNLNWIRNLQDITNVSQPEEFTNLFMTLSSVSLTQDRDQVSWRWTEDGQFIVVSAYECQFWGSMTKFASNTLWRAQSKSKCRFFS